MIYQIIIDLEERHKKHGNSDIYDCFKIVSKVWIRFMNSSLVQSKIKKVVTECEMLLKFDIWEITSHGDWKCTVLVIRAELKDGIVIMVP